MTSDVRRWTIYRYSYRNRRAAPWHASNFHTAADNARAIFDTGQTETAAARITNVKSGPRVSDDKAQVAAHAIESQRRLARARVFPDIGQGLTRDAKYFGFDIFGERADLRDVKPYSYARVGGELARQRCNCLGKWTSLECGRTQASDRSPGFVETLMCGIERFAKRRSGAIAWRELRETRFDVQRDGGESLGECIVDVASDSCSFVGARMFNRLFAEARSLDRHTHLIRNRSQKIELVACQPAPVAHRQIHDAERPGTGIQRDAGMTTQAVRQRGLLRFDRRRKTAALDDVNVACRQLAALK